MIETFRYDTSLFPFRNDVEQMLNVRNLEQLHYQDGVPTDIVETGKDNHTIWHNKFYDALTGSYFENHYKAFLRLVLVPYFKENLVFQARPTFRIHWVGNLSVGSYHKDSEYNHPLEELNFWIPITNAFGTNSIFIESEPDKGDFKSQFVEYGSVLQFPGGLLKHGNQINNTSQTRVSFDFRVIPESKYKDRPDLFGVAFGKKRILGDYYQKL